MPISWPAKNKALIAASLVAPALVGLATPKLPNWILLLSIALVIVVTYLILPRQWHSPLIGILLLTSLVDLTTHISLGPITAHGAATIATAVIATLGVLATATRNLRLPVWGPFALAFTAWTIVITIANGLLTIGAAQNLLLYAVFLMLAIYTRVKIAASPDFARILFSGFVIAGFISSFLYMASSFLPVRINDFKIDARPFALAALVYLAVLVPVGTRTNNRWAFSAAILLTILIVLSLSRTAMVLAAVVWIFSRLQLSSVRRWLTTAALVAATIAIGMYAVEHIGSLNERFYGGDRGFSVFGYQIDASGRAAIWRATWNHILESRENLIAGTGAGSSQRFVLSLTGTISHPHNDYLRIAFDYGFVGLGLWLIVIFLMFGSSLKGLLRAESAHSPEAPFHLAALLVIICLLASMFTDNVVVYLFAVAPAGIIIGISEGLLQLQHPLKGYQR